jgi:hypothetical protein
MTVNDVAQYGNIYKHICLMGTLEKSDDDVCQREMVRITSLSDLPKL